MKASVLIFCFVLFQTANAQYSRIKLSTLSLNVPTEVTKDNKVSRSKVGVSTYAWNRLWNDSSAYYFTYSFRFHNGVFELRETIKEDVYEWLVTSYTPKLSKRKEQKYYNEDVFLGIQNPLLKGKLQGITNESIKGIRKITLVYKLDETHQFLASIKSAGTPERFLDLQDSLVKMLESLEYSPMELPKHPTISQSGDLSDKTDHLIIPLPLALSNDFNNPVIEKTKDGGFLVAFAHSHGSEILRFDKNIKLVSHQHFDKIIHDIASYGDDFFTLSSVDYNLLSFGIYPSLYLTKHDQSGKVLFWQPVFKKYKLKVPGNQVFDYYSRDNVCLEIADSVGIVYCTTEKKWSDFQVGQAGAYKTFSTESGFLKKGEKDLWHVSHCFSQKTTSDGDHAYLFSLGDNFPRNLSLSKVNITMHKDSTDTTSFWQKELFKISGTNADNYIGDSHISEPVTYHGRLFIALETEIEAKTDHEDNPYSVNRGNNDIYIISCTLEGEDIKVKQVTKSKHIEEVNPKIAVHNDQLLLIYTEVVKSRVGDPASFEDRYIYIDERNNRSSNLEPMASVYATEDPSTWLIPDSPINRDGAELLELNDGTVIWVRLLKNARQLEIMRFH